MLGTGLGTKNSKRKHMSFPSWSLYSARQMSHCILNFAQLFLWRGIWRLLTVSIPGYCVVGRYYFEKKNPPLVPQRLGRKHKVTTNQNHKGQSVEKVASFRKDELPQSVRRPFWELEVTRNQTECSKNKQPKNRKKTPKQNFYQIEAGHSWLSWIGEVALASGRRWG